VKTFNNEADYEPLRVWALHPSSVRLPGIAQMLRGGLITWLQTAQSLPVVQSGEVGIAQMAHVEATPLSTLIASMIREVCQ